MNRIFFLLSAVVLATVLSACQKLPPQPQEAAAGVPPKAIPMTDAIPLEYGDLVGLAAAETPGWALLYFQRADKSLVAVYVNAQRGIIWDTVVDIPRR
jgi:hypothetical protein